MPVIAARRTILPEPDEPRRIGVRQRPHEHVIGDREDRGVRADAERGDDDRGSGEPGRSREHARGVAHILARDVPMRLDRTDDKISDDTGPEQRPRRQRRCVTSSPRKSVRSSSPYSARNAAGYKRSSSR
jgi:hypothetical protein